MCHWLEVTKPTPTIIVNYIALKLHSYLGIVSGVEDKKNQIDFNGSVTLVASSTEFPSRLYYALLSAS
jgi:hypothetical protein